MNTKSEICTAANQLMKQGYTKSEAFIRAWALAKAEVIENELFVLNLADRYTYSENKRAGELHAELCRLYARANSHKQKIVVLSDAEKAAINSRLYEILNAPGEIDWNAYAKLEDRLKGRAA